jgi:hypothetical protein
MSADIYIALVDLSVTVNGNCCVSAMQVALQPPRLWLQMQRAAGRHLAQPPLCRQRLLGQRVLHSAIQASA